MILDLKDSIIGVSNQSKKWRILTGLCMGSGVILIIDIIVITFDSTKLSKFILDNIGEEIRFAIAIGAIVIALISMILLCLSIKCPRCRLKWFWHAMAKDHKRDITIGHMSHCPRCNYPHQELKAVRPKLVSKAPILEVSNQKNKFRNLWRAFFAASAILLIGIIGLIHYPKLFYLSRILFFGGFIGVFAMLVSLWITIRCPKCGLRWYWHAFSKDAKYLRIGRITACPRCDYPN